MAADAAARRFGWAVLSLVLLYSIAVLTHVARMGTIGVRCMFGTKVEEEIPADYVWQDGAGRGLATSLLSIGAIRDPRGELFRLHPGTAQLERTGRRDDQGALARSEDTERFTRPRCTVQYPPSWTYYRSCVWFLQELLIFAIGARVFWKRPDDDSAQLFFAVCIVTVGAFMGGYHWTEIVTEPRPDLPIRAFRRFRAGGESPFLSGLSLEPIPFSSGTGSWVLGALYGIPTAYLAGALGEHVRGTVVGAPRAATGRRSCAFSSCAGSRWATSRWRCSSSACASSAWSSATAMRGTRAERNQVQWILLASLISLGLDRLSACAGLDRSRDAGARQRRLADVRRIAPVHDGLRLQHHALQADAGRGDHQPQRGLLRLQPDGGADLFGRALGQRQVDRRSVVLDPLDVARGGRGGALGDRGVDPVRGGPRAVSAGDRPPVLPGEVQVRSGDAEDAAGGGQPDRPGDAGPPAARGGGRGFAAGVGRALPGRRAGPAAATGGQPRPGARRAVARARQSAGGPVAADADGPAFPRPGTRTAPRTRPPTR